MHNQINTAVFLQELMAEATASRKCVEKIPESLFEFKPHPSSMEMGYLALLVAEIPKWIAVMVEEGEIDFATYKHADIKTAQELLAHFDENMQAAKKALENASAADLEKTFYLKAKGEVLFSEKVVEYIGPTINHWVHHRGQLTVYMRMNEIPVPSIYGPSADDKNYQATT
ncbi:MAG: DinB family protein [Chitinophagaceae bacterium]